MMEVAYALRWYVVMQLFGLAALPLARRFFRRLPDGGYTASKPLGLILTGWVFWLLNSFGWMENTAGAIVVALALVAVAGIFIPRCPRKLTLRSVLLVEALFAITFATWCVVRTHMPRIEPAGGEKWMEIAFLNAILRSPTFPPHDPWLSGFAISYYYFGYVIVAMVTRLATVPATIAFNLAIATLFGLTCSGAFGLLYNLLMASRWGQRIAEAGALTGPLLVAVIGNLEALLETAHALGLGPAAFWRWLDIRSINGPPPESPVFPPERRMWWWQSSRVIHDYTPWGETSEVIDEFPAFSFLLGDMHPHVLALPFVLLALSLALEVYLRVSRRERGDEADGWPRWAGVPFAPWDWVVYAVCLGGLGFLNTWDLPTGLLIVAASYAIATRERSLLVLAGRVMRLLLPLLVIGLAFYWPFWVGFQSQAGGLLPNLFNGTRGPQFVVMFGPLIFLVVAFVISHARRTGVEGKHVLTWAAITVLGSLAVLLLIFGVLAFALRRGVISPQGPLQYILAWLQGEPIPGIGVVPGFWLLFRNRFLLDPALLDPAAPATWNVILRTVVASPLWTSLGLMGLIVALILIYRRSCVSPGSAEGEIDVWPFALLLVLVGALLTFGLEYVYLRDNFATRMNSVFKFYFQTWVMWAIAGGYALVWFIYRRRWLVAGGGLALILAGLLFLGFAIPHRAGEHAGAVTLDGATHLRQSQFGDRPSIADDFRAIEWINRHIAGTPVILEAPGGGYDYEGRVSAFTGLPAVLGWAGHEAQWRGSYTEQGQREADIETIYTSPSAGEVLTLLDKHGISYVYVGRAEWQRYPRSGLAKFDHLLTAVYDTEWVKIYRR